MIETLKCQIFVTPNGTIINSILIKSTQTLTIQSALFILIVAKTNTITTLPVTVGCWIFQLYDVTPLCELDNTAAQEFSVNWFARGNKETQMQGIKDAC